MHLRLFRLKFSNILHEKKNIRYNNSIIAHGGLMETTIILGLGLIIVTAVAKDVIESKMKKSKVMVKKKN